MDKLGKWCIKIEEWLGGLLLLLMLVIVFLGTVGRYTGWYNMFWSDEAARYCMIWSVFLLAGLSAQRGQMFSIDILSDKLPPKGQKAFAVIRLVLVTAFCIFACYYGFDMVAHQVDIGQISPSMKLPMWAMYASVPIGCLMLLVHYVVHTIQKFEDIRNIEEGK